MSKKAIDKKNKLIGVNVKMKKKKVIAAVILLALVLLAGCAKPAAPMDLPPDDAVTGVSIVTTTGDEVAVTEPGKIEAVMNLLRAAKPTRRQSVNDQPTNVASYGTVNLHADGQATVVYYYEKDGGHYIEQPYRGIYRAEASPEDLLRQPE